MMNNVTLVGRLTKDIELNHTTSGTAVASFTLAVNRNFKNQQGEYDADFIRCQAWRKTAEVISQYGYKGMLVGITGRIQTRSYDDQSGQRVYITEVVVDSFRMLERKKDRQNQNNFEDSFQNDVIDIHDSDLPF